MNPFDVVSNTSPLIFLDKINALHVLKSCFGTVYIPDRVKMEWAKGELPMPICLRSLSVFGKSYVEGAVGRLHAGELEAIQLATEMNIKVVLLDDLLARKLARRKGLTPIGVLGVLRLAVKKGVMTFGDLQKNVTSLIDHHGLYISDEILTHYFGSF